MEEEKEWYVVHTYSGHENKVKANLEKRMESTGMQDLVFRILVPVEEKIERKQGQRQITKKKIFPGYVLVEMIMNDDSWYVVRNTPGVTGFVSSGTKPIPLQEEEVSSILRKMGVEKGTIEIDFELGQSVRIIDGPFEEFIGEIEEINAEKGTMKVLVSMFGRETPLEVTIDQVEEV